MDDVPATLALFGSILISLGLEDATGLSRTVAATLGLVANALLLATVGVAIAARGFKGVTTVLIEAVAYTAFFLAIAALGWASAGFVASGVSIWRAVAVLVMGLMGSFVAALAVAASRERRRHLGKRQVRPEPGRAGLPTSPPNRREPAMQSRLNAEARILRMTLPRRVATHRPSPPSEPPPPAPGRFSGASWPSGWWPPARSG